MGRFSEEQKRQIELSLIKESKRLFQLYGYDKTSIQDITKEVGIAQGTFYSFFSSKAHLYFCLLELEEEKLRDFILQKKRFKGEQPSEYVKRVLKEIVHIFKTNRLLQDLLLENNFSKLIRSIPEKTITRHIANDHLSLKYVLDYWKQIGIMLNIDTNVFASILRSLFILTIHQKEIGELYYEQTIELIIESVVTTIIAEE